MEQNARVAFLNQLFGFDFTRQGPASQTLGGTSNLGAIIAWFDSAVLGLANAIKGVELPSGTSLSDADVAKIVAAIKAQWAK